MAANARHHAVEIVRLLRTKGHDAYLAGGCVRDEILGLHPKDYDVATDATPDRIAALFTRTREVGKAFGVMHVQSAGVTIEVATFRKEGVYTDRRRPDSVTFADARADAHRRDFTINALFIDPLAPPTRVRNVEIKGLVIDHVGGIEDMSRRVIRAVGDPAARLAEDNLRALRAVRFAARLEFNIDHATADAIRHHAAELAGVSRERIGDEVRRMMHDPARARAAELMQSLGLDAPTLDQPAQSSAQINILRALDPRASHVAALAAWALDRASPRIPLEQAAHYRRALCLSNDETTHLASLMRLLADLESAWQTWPIAPRKRAAASPWFEETMRLLHARHAQTAARLEADVAALAASPPGLAPAPLVTGDDLVAEGIQPGPRFGTWLDEIYDQQLEGRLTTRDQAIELARRLASG